MFICKQLWRSELSVRVRVAVPSKKQAWWASAGSWCALLISGSAANFSVINTQDSGPGSLRNAILSANATSGTDSISFSIPGAGVRTITPLTALPVVTDSVIIDGSTQPGFSGTPLIELNGANVLTVSDGLRLETSHCVIRGVILNRWKSDGIELQGGGNHVVEGCYIGVSSNGIVDQGNSQNGIFVNGSSSNRIGGSSSAQRNIISGNDDNGLLIQGIHAAQNRIEGNSIGLNASGTLVLGNNDHGIWVDSAPKTQIGGTSAGTGNLISGNRQHGILISELAAAGTLVQGNWIGTDVTGVLDRGNALNGIHISRAPKIVIGGSTIGARNVISGNNGDGIEIESSESTETLIQSNLIGTQASGSLALANAFHGVHVNGAIDTRIGTDVVGTGNVISGNQQHGIALSGATTARIRIQGNNLGTDISGTLDVGNSLDGININGVGGTLIGGTTPGSRNVISGNNNDGIELTGLATSDTVIQGNFIGTDATQRSGIPNFGSGVFINTNARRSQIGGTGTNEQNRIAFNVGSGVFIAGGSGHLIRGNSIDSNTGLGIDLGVNGLTRNDADDSDAGPNSLQNFPWLTQVVLHNDKTTVHGTLQSIANSRYTLDFYANDAVDSSGNGEGKNWLGAFEVTTDGSGLGSFAVDLSGVTTARFITSTATDSIGNTSEFSAVRRAVTTTTPSTYVVSTTADSGLGSLRQAILEANTSLNLGDRIVFQILGTGPHTINPVTPLPPVTAPVLLDGYSQPGSSPNSSVDGFDAAIKIVLDGNASGVGIDGLRIEGPQATVRGLNIIRFRGDGIEIGSGSFGSVIEGCVIGLGLDNLDLGNGQNGLLVLSPRNRIGGSKVSMRNVLSGNGKHGIEIIGAGADRNEVMGCLIGTDLTGTRRLGNDLDGVHITYASNTRIGSEVAGSGNWIGGNIDGIELENADTSIIQGNRIGVGADGLELRNSGSGIAFNHASDTLVGGNLDGSGNIIARNSGRGINLINPLSVRNSFRGNSIYSNGGLGINLLNNGRTTNDPGDSDSGANGLQNYPELTEALLEVDATRVSGKFQGASSRTFELECFANTEIDATGFVEGKQFLGAFPVVTDQDGNATFEVILPRQAIGRLITATATSPDGNTSEFSTHVRASSTIPPREFTVTNTSDTGFGSLRQAILDADMDITRAPHKIVFAIPGEGPHTITPLTALPTPAHEPIEVDGFTQPGARPNSLEVGYDAIHKIRLDGTKAPVGTPGLRLSQSNNAVRGLIILNFREDGLEFSGDQNLVEGCLIGLDPGLGARGNSGSGISLIGTASGNLIGGGEPRARNILTGNLIQNVELASSTGMNRVIGNYIGTNPDGSALAPTAATLTGVLILNSPDNLIGGSAAGEGNVIGGHKGAGILIRQSGATGNRIMGNRIGTDATGLLPVANVDGVSLANAPGNRVGGPGLFEGNRIAFNQAAGVSVTGATNRNHNAIRGNQIYGNGTLGIDLATEGVLENDADDVDDTANRGQNFPVLLTAVASPESFVATGTLNSVANRSFTIDLYSNVACDKSGNGEGQQYLGAWTLETGDDGKGTFNAALPITVSGRFISATATDSDGNTSEFCDCLEATTEFPNETFTVTNTQDAGPGSFREALLANNASVGGGNNRIEFNIPGDDVQVLRPLSPWPAINHAVTIDGYTQPGSRPNSLQAGSDAILKIQLEAISASGSRSLELRTRKSILRGLSLCNWTSGFEVYGNENEFLGNFVGIDPKGIAQPKSTIGILLMEGSGNRIGSGSPADRNVLSGNQTAIEVRAAARSVSVQGNLIGTDPSGQLARPNQRAAIILNGEDHVIGGAFPGAGNLISGNSADAIRLNATTRCTIQGNWIGTDVSGLLALPNVGHGINVLIASDSWIGGGSAGARNVISGNNLNGIFLDGKPNVPVRVQGNYIGVGADGIQSIPNGVGIAISGSGHSIGGVAPGEGNRIENNRGEGLSIIRSDAVRNTIRGNSVFKNQGLGINLGVDKVTLNDAGDLDEGANQLQNYPRITKAVVHPLTVDIEGTLESHIDKTFTLDFFASRAPDDSGMGEAEEYLGSITATTGLDGIATFKTTLESIPKGRWITATATDASGNTSELSKAFRASSTRPPGSFVVWNVKDSGPGSLRQAILDVGSFVSGVPHRIRFEIPGETLHTIELLSPLPTPGAAIELDGYSQSGSRRGTSEDRDNAVRLIRLDGRRAGENADGLSVTTGGNVVRGLEIRGFSGTGIRVFGDESTVIEGCHIFENRQSGITLEQSKSNRIGATIPAGRNLLTLNGQSGIRIVGGASIGNRVLGNFIGVASDGSTGSPNTIGVLIENAVGTRIGGLAAGEANWIRYNSTVGVQVNDGNRNTIRGNRIFDNGTLGIDLGRLGLTLNDDGDSDDGANSLQNFPLLTSATAVIGGTRIIGTLGSRSNSAVTLDFYHSPSCDRSGYGEGFNFIGSADVLTTSDGSSTFNIRLPHAGQPGVVTATATDSDGNTSEFCGCVVEGTEIPPITAHVTTVEDNQPGSLRQALKTANENYTTGPNIIKFQLPIGETHILAPQLPFPPIIRPLTLDGFTQPGSQPDITGRTLHHKILVRLDGFNVPEAADGLAVLSDNVTVRGIMITGWGGAGIRAVNSSNLTIHSCFIGTDGSTKSAPDPLGTERVRTYTGLPSKHGATASFHNQDGIRAEDLSGILVTDSVISGNAASGIVLINSSRIQIQHNIIGLDSEKSRVLGNGLHLDSANPEIHSGSAAIHLSWNQIGVDAVLDQNWISDNIIAGNGGAGIRCETPFDFFRPKLVIQRNHIGTSQLVTKGLGNMGDGIHLSGVDSVAILANHVLQNRGAGIRLGSRTINTLVTGNSIGGTEPAMGNRGGGCIFEEGAERNRVGGKLLQDRNSFLFNGGPGIVDPNAANDILYNSFVAGGLPDRGGAGPGGLPPTIPEITKVLPTVKDDSVRLSIMGRTRSFVPGAPVFVLPFVPGKPIGAFQALEPQAAIEAQVEPDGTFSVILSTIPTDMSDRIYGFAALSPYGESEIFLGNTTTNSVDVGIDISGPVEIKAGGSAKFLVTVELKNGLATIQSYVRNVSPEVFRIQNVELLTGFGSYQWINPGTESSTAILSALLSPQSPKSVFLVDCLALKIGDFSNQLMLLSNSTGNDKDPGNNTPSVSGEVLSGIETPFLGIRRDPITGLTWLTWPDGSVLQSADSFPGVFLDVPGAKSPYSIPTGSSQSFHQFFRTRR